MRNFALLAATALLVAGSPALSQGNGNGHGNGPNKAHANSGKGPGAPGKKDERGGPPKVAERGPPAAGAIGRDDKGKGPGKDMTRVDRTPPGQREADRGPEYADRGPDLREVRDRVNDRIERVHYTDGGRWYDGGNAVIDGCPPGLAKKNNGCLPPGQAKKLWGNTRSDDNWYGNWGGWRGDSRYDYRYSDGYLYRVDPRTSVVSGFLPLLGGALFGGNVWPQSYSDYAVPQYYDNYYGYNDGLDYRYADGAILGVNPQSGAIDAIAALLTGSDWTVGQAMPAGYDFYNVPPQYRDRYADSDRALYRYSDGYVYEIDPTTRLVQAAIELLA